jgi:hypothetical protein
MYISLSDNPVFHNKNVNQRVTVDMTYSKRILVRKPEEKGRIWLINQKKRIKKLQR